MSAMDLIERREAERAADAAIRARAARHGYPLVATQLVIEEHIKAIRAIPAVPQPDTAARLAAAEAVIETLMGALEVAHSHVANNAQGWSVGRGASREDQTIVDAALTTARKYMEARNG